MIVTMIEFHDLDTVNILVFQNGYVLIWQDYNWKLVKKQSNHMCYVSGLAKSILDNN